MFSDHQMLQYNSLVRSIYSSLNLQELCMNALNGLQHLIPYHSAAFIQKNPQNSEILDSTSVIVHSFNPPLFEKNQEMLFSSPVLLTHLRYPLCLQAISFVEDPTQYRSEFLLAQGIHFAARMQIFHQELHCGELALHRKQVQQNFNGKERFILKLLQEHINSSFSQLLVQQVNQDMHFPKKNWELTRREAQIASLIGQGKTNKHIAQDLGVSENTIKTILKRLYHKLGVHSRSELIRELYNLTPASYGWI